MTLAPSLTRLTGAAALGIATALSPVAMSAVAQEQDTQQPQTEMQPQPDMQSEGDAAASETAFSDDDLSSFVDAAMAVSDVRDTFIPQVQNAETEEAAQALAQEAVAEMREAVVETDGIDVETYMAIGEAAETDEGLAQRISAIVQDRQGADPSAPEDG